MRERSKEKVEVIAYSGYRSEEAPRAILLHGKRIEVIDTLKQWVEEKSDDRERKRFYQVKGSDGILHRIYYNERTMEWFRIL